MLLIVGVLMNGCLVNVVKNLCRSVYVMPILVLISDWKLQLASIMVPRYL